MDGMGLAAGALFLLAGAMTFLVAMCRYKNMVLAYMGGAILTAWGVYTLLLALTIVSYSRVGISIGQYTIAGWLVVYMSAAYARLR